MRIWLFGFCSIKPSHIIETKVYVKNEFLAAKTTFISCKLYCHFLRMELHNKAMKDQAQNKN